MVSAATSVRERVQAKAATWGAQLEEGLGFGRVLVKAQALGVGSAATMGHKSAHTLAPPLERWWEGESAKKWAPAWAPVTVTASGAETVRGWAAAKVGAWAIPKVGAWVHAWALASGGMLDLGSGVASARALG